MATTTKKLKAAESIYDREKDYSVEEAFGILKKLPNAKFDESVDMSLRLGVDPKHADQMVRGAIVLPHGIGKAVRVAVFAKGEKDKEARDAGADVVGAEDLVEKIQGGFMDFDSTIATPDLMGQVGRLGKVTQQQVREIAQTKLVDLNTDSIDSAMRIIEGTARSMGIEVVG